MDRGDAGDLKDIKVSLVNLCILTVPSQQDTFRLHTDASGAGIGATLNVIREGEAMPVAYYSKQIQGAQKCYSATELEGLAIFKSVHYFAHFLFGRHFTVVTDHKALVAFLHSRVLNKRLQGWMLELAQFDFDIIYRPGADNCDADALSRQAWDIGEDGPWKPAELEQKEQEQLRFKLLGEMWGPAPQTWGRRRERWGPAPQTWRRRRKKEENREKEERKELTQDVELSRRWMV